MFQLGEVFVEMKGQRGSTILSKQWKADVDKIHRLGDKTRKLVDKTEKLGDKT